MFTLLEDIRKKLLKMLNPIENAHIRREKGCMEGTRIPIIEQIMNWILRKEESDPQVCVLYGNAGTGKSAIAHTIGRRVKELGQLGAFFCFDRNFAVERTPIQALHTLAYDLAWKSLEFGTALLDIIE